jgi:hypothetical protein
MFDGITKREQAMMLLVQAALRSRAAPESGTN